MSQPDVSHYYATRKRLKDVIKNVEAEQSSKIDDRTVGVLLGADVKLDKVRQEKCVVNIDCKKKTVEKKSKSGATRKKNVKQSSASGKQQDIRTLLLQDKKKTSKSKTTVELKESNLGPSSSCLDETVSTHNVDAQSELPRTPKRNLSEPDELTPSKKQHIGETETSGKDDSKPTLSSSDHSVRRKLHLESPIKKIASSKGVLLNGTGNMALIKNTPKKQSVLPLSATAVAKSKPINEEIVIKSLNKNKDLINKQSPQKSPTMGKLDNESLVSLIKQSRSKILASGKLDELKESLKIFSKSAAAIQQFQANSCKITSVITTQTSSKEQVSTINREPEKTKFSYLSSPDSTSSLILPYKYQLLCETFRCMDAVVSILHNRKERASFGKVKEGVQKMNNRTFTQIHIGQIMTILPSAYSLHYEKNDFIINKKNDSPDYQLIIEPNLIEGEDSAVDTQTSSHFLKSCKPSKSNAFVHMSPQHLMERRGSFQQNILKLVKRYHHEFLTRLRFPLKQDGEILRWHPNFKLDSVPDIECAELPETPEIKFSSAKDVLNKLRGKVKGRVQKALESVAEESGVKIKPNEVSNNVNTRLNRKPNNALSGICTDLIEKIRARENMKCLESMMRSPDEAKRLAMLENIPKIVHILWHYFIAERKAAVPVDMAVEKIIHSLNSQKTPDEIKEHLQLIAKTCPGWLSFINIPKGEYITMDKKKDINIMLNNIKH